MITYGQHESKSSRTRSSPEPSSAVAGGSYLSEELAFRGGTALHKLHLDRPSQCSEDLDYVRNSATGIAPLPTAGFRCGSRSR